EEGSKLTAIGGAVFKNCTSLREITLPDGLLSISGNAFRFCKNLHVYIPESVTSIDAATFSSTTDVTLYVYENSYAHQWAVSNEMNFVIVTAGNEDDTTAVSAETVDGVEEDVIVVTEEDTE
ncbi:MAG: leucine-rich repeat domain-containing protein, partial [Clostridiales bacterium]|nr:leucine-rich repeat domain-containing protein [Clostridiales bacterium]